MDTDKRMPRRANGLPATADPVDVRDDRDSGGSIPASSLLDDLAAPSAPIYGARCTVAIILDTLEGETRAAVAREVNGDRLPASELSRRLRRNGIELTEGTIRRHRQRGCQCRT